MKPSIGTVGMNECDQGMKMITPALGAVLGAKVTLGPIALAIKALYNMGEAVNDFVDRHIATLKQSDSPIIASTGRVLEAAKLGFGLGYVSSVAIIAAGQLLLGNPLAAAGAVASAATLTNPIAMTCAAVGALYYGWGALSEKERAALLDRLTDGLQMGMELIKALIEFVVRKTNEFLSSRQLTEFKVFIKTQAASFGKSLYDVTHAVGDMVRGAAEFAGDIATQAVDLTGSTSRKAAAAASDAATKVATTATDAARSIGDRLRGSGKDQ